jgi:uncharacterized protein
MKPPIPGKTKTRLVPFVTPEKAAELSKAFFEDTIATISSLNSAEVRVIDTPADDLGEAMEAVFRSECEKYSQVFVVGADSPGISANIFAQAQRGLETHDAVIGPTEDGGFYLLGFKQYYEGILSDLPWSQSNTLDSTLKRFQKLNLSTFRADRCFDIDTPDDLKNLVQRLRKREIFAPHTEKALRRIGML